MFERAAKHDFVEAFMGGADAAMNGGNMGQAMLHGMFSGALSSAGNGFINSHVDGLARRAGYEAIKMMNRRGVICDPHLGHYEHL